jgi:hypothetical protein
MGELYLYLLPGSFILASANIGMDTEYISEVEGTHKADSRTSCHDGVIYEWWLVEGA